MSERIELPGDHDRFTLALESDELINVALRKPAGDGVGALRVRVSGNGMTPVSITSFHIANTQEGHISTGNLRLARGTYDVVVESATARMGGFVGRYELTAFAIDTTPEQHPQLVALGDTIIGERVDHVGDIDSFSFTGTAGQSVYTFIAPDISHVWIEVAIIHPTLGRLVRSPDHITGPLGPMRVELPDTGPYELRVGPFNSSDREATGGYRAVVVLANPAPESRTSTIQWSEAVADERTDFRGDIDEFTITGPPGQEATASFFSQSGFPVNMELSVLDAGSGAAIAFAGYTHQINTGRFRIPAGGVLRLRVAERPMCMAPGYCYHSTGPYTMRARLIDRAPDNIAARVAVGDTVAGEAVDFPGDIDEFVFTGTAGQRLRLVLRAGQPISFDGSLVIELVDPATNALLASAGATWTEASTPVVELPASRDYLVRVRGASEKHDAAPFSFILQAP